MVEKGQAVDYRSKPTDDTWIAGTACHSVKASVLSVKSGTDRHFVSKTATRAFREM